jgi:hypothetical protein
MAPYRFVLVWGFVCFLGLLLWGVPPFLSVPVELVWVGLVGWLFVI